MRLPHKTRGRAELKLQNVRSTVNSRDIQLRSTAKPQVLRRSVGWCVDVDLAGRTTGRIGATGPQSRLAAGS
jgi:hypothetical protein